MKSPAAADAPTCTHQATISRVRVKAVKTVVTMPMPSVTAKPRTGPLPKKNSTAAAMKVVMFGIENGRERAGEPGVDGGDRACGRCAPPRGCARR